ncbi:hypothetical protein M9458_055860, partial [Cirrhinus mrigala]
PSAKLLQSQLSTQVESSGHSDSSDELPPTPPNQLLWPAKKVSDHFQNPTDQYVASYTPLWTTSHAAQRGASPTAQQGASTTNPGVTSPRAQGITSPTATVTSATPRGVTSPIARRATSPTATITSPTCEAMFTKLLTILEEVKETQQVHSKMLNALLKKQDGSVVEVPEGVVLPLKTQSDLEALDQKLGDRSVMSAV